MTVQVGAADYHEFSSPRASLLREITGIEPEPGGVHALLDKHLGTRSTQRLAVADVGGAVLVALWPAELKSQAEYLYSEDRGVAMVRAARERGWKVDATPHLAFFTAHPSQRLYMYPDEDAEAYVRRWQGADGRRIRQHTREELREQLWPWLVGLAYASPADASVLDEFLAILGRRPVHLRPGLSFKKRWSDAVGEEKLAQVIRDEVNGILAAAGEQKLPPREL